MAAMQWRIVKAFMIIGLLSQPAAGLKVGVKVVAGVTLGPGATLALNGAEAVAHFAYGNYVSGAVCVVSAGFSGFSWAKALVAGKDAAVSAAQELADDITKQLGAQYGKAIGAELAKLHTISMTKEALIAAAQAASKEATRAIGEEASRQIAAQAAAGTLTEAGKQAIIRAAQLAGEEACRTIGREYGTLIGVELAKKGTSEALVAALRLGAQEAAQLAEQQIVQSFGKDLASGVIHQAVSAGFANAAPSTVTTAASHLVTLLAGGPDAIYQVFREIVATEGEAAANELLKKILTDPLVSAAQKEAARAAFEAGQAAGFTAASLNVVAGSAASAAATNAPWVLGSSWGALGEQLSEDDEVAPFGHALVGTIGLAWLVSHHVSLRLGRASGPVVQCAKLLGFGLAAMARQ